MCGILGLFSNQARSNLLRRSLKSLSHRGPDHEGVLYINSHSMSLMDVECPIGLLGHRRLSIIDLSGLAKQPMVWDHYAIVYNGEIYNFREIREELELEGIMFCSQSDTEVVLKGYIQWGQALFTKLRGMWALAIWDHKRKILFLSRDRFGVKPLFYWNKGGQFAFASEMKALFGLGCVDTQPDVEGVNRFLFWGPPEYQEQTLFHGIQKLLPGHHMTVTFDQDFYVSHIQTERYYHLPQISKDIPHFTGSFEEAAAEFRHLFQRAVEYALISDVPIGSSLSGGLDSSSIVATIQRLLRKGSKVNLQGLHQTFSSVFHDPQYRYGDESEYIHLLRDFLSVENHQVLPSSKRFLQEYERYLWHQEEPVGGGSAFAGWCVADLVSKQGIRVLLDGQGADEFLGGYHYFHGAWFSEMRKKPLKLISLLLSKNNALGFSKRLRYLIAHLLPLTSKKAYVQTIAKGMGYQGKIPMDHPFFTEYQTVRDAQVNSLQYGIAALLKLSDRNCMAFSVESRPPYLDHTLIEFALSLPSSFILYNGWTKYIARKAFEPYLPKEIVWRKDKMGFPVPEAQWVKELNQGMKDVAMNSPLLKSLPVSLKKWDDFSTNARFRLFEIAVWQKTFHL